MARERFERLITVFDGAKADGRFAPSPGWMQLTQGNHGLAVALRVESDRRPEQIRIVSVIGAVINLDQRRRLDTAEQHAVGVALAIGRNHVEAPQSANADVDLLGLDFETGRSEPVRQM